MQMALKAMNAMTSVLTQLVEKLLGSSCLVCLGPLDCHRRFGQ